MMDATTDKDAPRSNNLVQAVCLASWNLHTTPASRLAVAHELLTSPIGIIGSTVSL